MLQYVQLKRCLGVPLIAVFVVLLLIPALGSGGNTWQKNPNVASELDNEPEVRLVEQSSNHLLLNFKFSGFEVTDKKHFKHLRITRDDSYGDAREGTPAIPFYNVRIHVPDGTKPELSLVEANWALQSGEYLIYPRQLPTRDDGSPPPAFSFNEKAYNSDIDFPSSNILASAPQGWGGIDVSSVSVSPFLYNPAQANLRFASEITIRIDFVPGEHHPLTPERISPKMRSLYNASLINPPQQFPDNDLHDADENTSVRMLFVLKEEALQVTQPLIDFHHRTGMRSEVLLVDGDNNINEPEELKDIIQEMYLEGLEYVFIVGDGYHRSPDVPMFLWNPEDPGWQDNESTASHSDNWYVCLDEPDENGFEDHLPELAIGRFTYDGPDDLDELQVQIDKTVDYIAWNFDDQDNAEWLGRAIMVASDARQDREFVYLQCKEDVINFEYTRDHPELIPYFGDDDEVNVGMIDDEVNDPGIGFFNYRGHGTETYMHDALHNRNIDRNVVWLFENRNMPFILVSSACLNANIATRRSDCLLEYFQKHDEGGAVGSHGSVISTYTPGNTYHDKRIFRAFFDEGITDLGYANNLAMTEMVLNWANDWYAVIGRMNTRAYIWLADPALNFRLGEPIDLNVDVPEEIAVATEWIDFAITDADGNPVSEAVVAVRNEDEFIYQTATSNFDGEARIEFDPEIPEAGFLTWTAYHRNSRVLVEGQIIAADAFGVLDVYVNDAENEQPIAGASVELRPMNAAGITDEEGLVRFEGVPERGGYEVTASAETYLDNVAQELVVRDGEVTRVDIPMYYAELSVDSMEVSRYLDAGDTTFAEITLANTGNGGPLRWTAELANEEGPDVFDVEATVELSEILNDTRLNGVVFDDDRYFVVGGNNNADPNNIYILNSDFELEDMFHQPGESFGVGFHDLAWNGEYFVSSYNEYLIYFDNTGELLGMDGGPYNPNRAITFDDDGNLWIANRTQPLMKTNEVGNVLLEIEHELQIIGLAWYEGEADGYELQILALGDNSAPWLYQMHPITRHIRLTADLTLNENDIPSEALYVTTDIFGHYTSLVGIVANGAERFLRIWRLEEVGEWVSIDLFEGELQPEESDEIIIRFDATSFTRDQVLETSIIINANGRNPQVEIPIRLEVDDGTGVPGRDQNSVPQEFTVYPAYPNPFNSQTKLSVYLPHNEKLTGRVFDLNGRVVATFHKGLVASGYNTFTIDAQGLSNGVYFISLTGQGHRYHQKLALIR